MDFNTLLLFLVLVLNTTLSELIKTGISELIVKPLAIRHGSKILKEIKGGSDTIKKAWDLLDYSLPQGVDNIIDFMGDAEGYIWETVLPELPDGALDNEEQEEALVQHLAQNWSKETFLNKIDGLLR